MVKVAEEQIAALEPKIPTLTLVAPSALPGFKATLDGEPVAADKLGQPLPLDPGKHKVHAEADGLPARDEELDLGEGRRVRLELDLKPADGPAAPAEGSSKVPAIVALGAGGAAVVAGLAVFIVSYTKDATINDECGGSERLRCPLSKKATIESQVSSANTFRVAGAVTGLVGLAGVGTGIALLLRAAPPPVTTGLVRVEPAVGPGFAGLGVSGRF